MRAVCGDINDSCFASFTVEIQGTTAKDMWSGDKTLVRGSTSNAKGKFRSISEEYSLGENKAYINYKDMVNNIQIIVTESKLAPLSKIRIGLPNPEKYVVSEFYVKGYFNIERVNVISLSKSLPGDGLMTQLSQGKKLNILDKIYIEKLGDPTLIIDTIETKFGAIQQIRNAQNLEI